MTNKQMPGWPKPSTFNLPRDYERARADYWEARCRVAVTLLNQMSGCVHPIQQPDIDEALSAIGPLPSTEETRGE